MPLNGLPVVNVPAVTVRAQPLLLVVPFVVGNALMVAAHEPKAQALFESSTTGATHAVPATAAPATPAFWMNFRRSTCSTVAFLVRGCAVDVHYGVAENVIAPMARDPCLSTR